LACLNWFEPGHPPWPVHTHPFDQIAFVLSGQMVFTLAEQEILVSSPSVVWIPRDMPHCANIAGDQPCLNLDVFGTPRADFLHLVQYQGAWGEPRE
jgi:quercetin dioxygenase-like cupin family protein